MPSATQLYNSGKMLNSADLVGNPNVGLNKRVPAVIHHVQSELVGQGGDQETKLVADLVSKQGQAWPKRLPMNKTNILAMVAAYGDDYSTWPGKPIEIWAENVMFAGKVVTGIRIAAVSNDAAHAPAIPVPAPTTPPSSATAVAGMSPAAAPTWNAPRSAATIPLEDDEIPF